jgi:hypothetical protein
MFEKVRKNDPLTEADLRQLITNAVARPGLVKEQEQLRDGESVLVLNVYF